MRGFCFTRHQPSLISLGGIALRIQIEDDRTITLGCHVVADCEIMGRNILCVTSEIP
jgi:hypothetical protein